MSTNTVIPGGLIHLSGLFFTSQEKHLPIPPILLTVETVWTHVETTGLIYCPVRAVVTKHRDWLLGTPGQPQVHDFHIFLSLSVSWPFFLLPLYLPFSALASSQINNLPVVTFPIGHSFATFIPKLDILQGDITRERCKQLHSDFPPLPAPSWPLTTVQHVHSKALKSNNASKTSSQRR